MPNGYIRPHSTVRLSKAKRAKLIRENFEHYQALAQKDKNLLATKVPRDAFKAVLDRVGALLIEEAKALTSEAGPVRDFLETNVPPASLAGLLPSEFRAFCLLLNAAKVWVSAEQAATDRYLLGGRAKSELRAVTDTCIIIGQLFGNERPQLHHPVRDGTPPIPLSHEGHRLLERQTSGARQYRRAGADGEMKPLDAASELALERIKAIKGSRSFSNLRKGCLDQIGDSVAHGTPNVRASSRSFAKKASEVTGLSYAAIIALMDQHQLGEGSERS